MTARVLSHVILGTNNIPRAIAFYDSVLTQLGHERRWHSDSGAGYGKGDERGIDTFWITKPIDGKSATVGNGTNVCFVAPTRKSVDLFHRNALEHGAVNEGDPGLRVEVHSNFYACYVRDLDGNKIVAACHEPV